MHRAAGLGEPRRRRGATGVRRVPDLDLEAEGVRHTKIAQPTPGRDAGHQFVRPDLQQDVGRWCLVRPLTDRYDRDASGSSSFDGRIEHLRGVDRDGEPGWTGRRSGLDTLCHAGKAHGPERFELKADAQSAAACRAPRSMTVAACPLAVEMKARSMGVGSCAIPAGADTPTSSPTSATTEPVATSFDIDNLWRDNGPARGRPRDQSTVPRPVTGSPERSAPLGRATSGH